MHFWQEKEFEVFQLFDSWPYIILYIYTYMHNKFTEIGWFTKYTFIEHNYDFLAREREREKFNLNVKPTQINHEPNHFFIK